MLHCKTSVSAQYISWSNFWNNRFMHYRIISTQRPLARFHRASNCGWKPRKSHFFLTPLILRSRMNFQAQPILIKYKKAVSEYLVRFVILFTYCVFYVINTVALQFHYEWKVQYYLLLPLLLWSVALYPSAIVFWCVLENDPFLVKGFVHKVLIGSLTRAQRSLTSWSSPLREERSGHSPLELWERSVS